MADNLAHAQLALGRFMRVLHVSLDRSRAAGSARRRGQAAAAYNARATCSTS
jgi:hypothetical protein